MDDVSFNLANMTLKVNQIACLEHSSNNLYGEVIQLVPLRQLCWFRPICLVISSSRSSDDNNLWKSLSELSEISPIPETRKALSAQETTKYSSQAISSSSSKHLSDPYFVAQEARLINLQSGSDLLWPAILFRPALDTEVIWFLAQLHEVNDSVINRTLNQQYFNTFIHQVWQANQDKF